MRHSAPLLLAALLFSLLWPASSARAAGDPSLEWHTIETPHFLIHYHDGLEEMATELAAVAEEAQHVFSPLFDWETGAKTQVVLHDFGDEANGFSRAVPYNLITLFAASPASRSTLSDFDDWLRGLFYHEYVHTLHIDTMSGLSTVINTLFGKLVAPNAALPRWILEGMAVYYESARTRAGRARSALVKMYLRAAALAERSFDLGQITGDPSGWLGLGAWYSYGGPFFSYIAATRGEASLTTFSHQYGAQAIPLGVNRAAKLAFGADFPTLYQEWQSALLAEGMASWVRTRAEGGPTPFTPITTHGYANDQPQWRPKHNQISYVRNTGQERRMVVLLDPDSGDQTELYRDYGSGRVAWHPDGEHYVSAELDSTERLYIYNDLFLRQVGEEKAVRLTTGQRARDPVFSPDGKRLVFVGFTHGGSHLFELELDTLAQDAAATPERLLSGAPFEQFYTPRFSADGTQLAVVRFLPSEQQRDLFIYDLSAQRFERITNNDALEYEPSFSPDGRWLVYVSDRDGQHQLYAFDLLRRQELRLSHVTHGVFAPAFDGEGKRLFASVYSARGYDLGCFDFEALLAQAEPAKPAKPSDKLQYSGAATQDFVHRDYEPWRYLWPRSWIPQFSSLFSSQSLSAALSLSLSGSDPTGQHLWTGSIFYDTELSHLGFSLGYNYGRLPVDLQFQAFHARAVRGYYDDFYERGYVEDQNSASVTAVLPFPGVRAAHSLWASYAATYFSLAEPLELVLDPLASPVVYPELGWFNSLRMGWSHSALDASDEAISTELGYTLSLSLGARSPLLGASVSSFETSMAASTYLPMPWLAHHVLAFHAAGAMGWADYRRRGLFVLGGIPPQDIVQTFVDGLGGVGGVHLRGYPQIAAYGDRYFLSNLEYRFPLFAIDQGFDTLPLFLGRLSAAFFSDFGAAWSGEFSTDLLKLGIGAELRLRTFLSYYLPAMFRLGYAWGANEGGLHHVFFIMGNQF
ncbi:MAG: BamA/TamA family outer membrane protein [Myxococcota bacterium]|jgi:Tol biopolymer transport system component|nr:BamA/TamA family outer membrane protein [Myxococcota bacterium]